MQMLKLENEIRIKPKATGKVDDSTFIENVNV